MKRIAKIKGMIIRGCTISGYSCNEKSNQLVRRISTNSCMNKIFRIRVEQ